MEIVLLRDFRDSREGVLKLKKTRDG